jgi:drug/metabolite transporter (DMT)-like permease
MQYSDWKIVSIFVVVLGVVFLAGAVIAFFYPPDPLEFGSLHDYPYLNYALPLFMAGAIFLVGGIVVWQRAKQKDGSA